MVDLVLALIVSTLAVGSSPEAGAPLAPASCQRVGATVGSLCIFDPSWWSYVQKLYPIGVGVSNDNVYWASFPSVEAFVVMLSARSMVF
ncbi:hypothetical protein SETIT_2G085900v2 [Setaria italica]|uniref:Secreted protein n=1 Tax=Setaria italica TaxID=4555 RepID=A0A368PWT1_SETIT|nr:hypothetical protein SETIT_2G085900v2 [Setaria italica]